MAPSALAQLSRCPPSALAKVSSVRRSADDTGLSTRMRRPGNTLSGVQSEGISGSYAFEIPRAVRAEGIQPEILETVVAAEKVQHVRPCKVREVEPGVDRLGIGDIDQAQGRGVLEQQAENAPALQYFPVVEAIISQAVVVRITDIQLPGIARDFESVPVPPA